MAQPHAKHVVGAKSDRHAESQLGRSTVASKLETEAGRNPERDGSPAMLDASVKRSWVVSSRVNGMAILQQEIA